MAVSAVGVRVIGVGVVWTFAMSDSAYAKDVLVSADWVEDHLDDFQSDDSDHRLVEVDVDTEAYDDEHGVFAARFLVTALLYGHENLHLLNGDFSAWNQSHETTSETPAVEPSTYEVREPTASPLVDFETVRDALDTDAVIVDTREAWEYEEGHLPGAVQLDWRELVDAETRGLKPDDELEALLTEREVTPDRRIVLYCNTARRISHTYVVLKHLGYETVDFYEGSLTEWRERGGRLVEGEAE